MYGADPQDKHPMAGFPQICFIKNTVSNPNIIIGDYTYYDDPDESEHLPRTVLYHFTCLGDRLTIGEICTSAIRIQFIMVAANHRLDGFSL